MAETIITTVDQYVTTLTFNRPRQKNAFNTRMYDEAASALREAQDNPGVAVVVLTGAGDAFSAGQDLGEMAALTEHGTDEPHGFPRFMDRLGVFDKPLLAAVNGVGVGIGFTMLLQCDLVYFSTTAKLRAPFLPLGVVPEAASSYLLPMAVGWQNAAEVLLTADWVDAPTAVTMGIGRAVLPPDQLLPTVLAKAHQIAAQPPGATRATKQLLIATRSEQIRAARAREDAVFAERIGNEENMEAVMAFLQKRPPDFTRFRQ
jgi:enoyl-CoA hydratase/carnithine racemase